MKNIAIFFALLATVNVFASGKWTIYRVEKEYSPKNDITSLCFDKQNNLWVSTSYGVFMFSDGTWIERGIQNAFLQTIFVDQSNNKWVGLYLGGVSRSNDGINWKKVPEATQSGTVNAISAGNDGSLWVGDWNEGLFHLPAGENSKWVSYRAETQVIGDNAVFSIIADRNDKVWAGTTHGVSVLQNNHWTLFNTLNSKLPDNVVYSIASDSNGIVWIGTANGLVKVNGNEWTVYNNENSDLSCDLILALTTDENGHVWAGTPKGAFYFNGISWTNYTVENSGLPDDRVQSVTVKNKKVYLGTSSGLAVYE